MNEIKVNPQYITRASFQWILHQSLVSDDRYLFCGLLGVSPDEPEVMQHVAMVKDVADVAQVLDVWADCNMVCVGFFHFEAEDIHPELLLAMPRNYIELKVYLREKGRLDLLAYACDKDQEQSQKLTLNLIEDRQRQANA